MFTPSEYVWTIIPWTKEKIPWPLVFLASQCQQLHAIFIEEFLRDFPFSSSQRSFASDFFEVKLSDVYVFFFFFSSFSTHMWTVHFLLFFKIFVTSPWSRNYFKKPLDQFNFFSYVFVTCGQILCSLRRHFLWLKNFHLTFKKYFWYYRKVGLLLKSMKSLSTA